jgi:hypothetical protein
MRCVLTQGLPLVEVVIGHSDAYREYCESQMEPVLPDLRVMALVDTGASITVIDSSVVSRLRLRDRGVCRVRGFDGSLVPHGAAEYLNYDISLIIGASDGNCIAAIGNLQAVGVSLGYDQYHVLLGLDVLRHCKLTLNVAEDYFEMISTRVGGLLAP